MSDTQGTSSGTADDERRERAIKFYKDVIGWGTQAFEAAQCLYMWTAAGRRWWRDDLPTTPRDGRAALARLRALTTSTRSRRGGVARREDVRTPMDIRSRRFSVIADPRRRDRALQGSGPEMRGAEAANATSRGTTHRRAVEAAFRFYSQLFAGRRPTRWTWGRWGPTRVRQGRPHLRG